MSTYECFVCRTRENDSVLCSLHFIDDFALSEFTHQARSALYLYKLVSARSTPVAPYVAVILQNSLTWQFGHAIDTSMSAVSLHSDSSSYRSRLRSAGTVSLKDARLESGLVDV